MLFGHEIVSARRKVFNCPTDPPGGHSVYLNINEGCSRRSISERKRYFEIARGSIIEIDAALDISIDLDFCKAEALTKCGEYIIRSFSMLSKLMAKSQ